MYLLVALTEEKFGARCRVLLVRDAGMYFLMADAFFQERRIEYCWRATMYVARTNWGFLLGVVDFRRCRSTTFWHKEPQNGNARADLKHLSFYDLLGMDT
jgi:hypothetical protein